MDIEQKQAELIDHFVKQASAAKGSALGSVVVEATSHPSLFAFSEILAVPHVIELEGTENSVYLDVLRLFAHGTWSDYKSNAGRLPQFIPDQILKLKQLTVLTLAETNKVLPYDQLMQELDVTNVRELEDFLINECMYAGIVRGKLDQLRRCFEVQFAAGRDLRPGQLGSMIQTLSSWLTTSESLLVSIQEKIKWADTMSEMDKKHKKEVEDKVDELKKSIFKVKDITCQNLREAKSFRTDITAVSALIITHITNWPFYLILMCHANVLTVLMQMLGYIGRRLTYFVAEVTPCKQADVDFQGHEEISSESGGVMDYEEDRSRPKRRRHPLS